MYFTSNKILEDAMNKFDHILPHRIIDRKKQIDINEDPYGKSVVDTADFIMKRLMKGDSPSDAWDKGMKEFPVHSGASASYVAVSVVNFCSRGREFRDWCIKNDVVMVKWSTP